MIYFFFGVKFFKYDFLFALSELFKYSFLRIFDRELTLSCQIGFDLIALLVRVGFFKFEFLFCSLFFSFVTKSRLYLMMLLFVSLVWSSLLADSQVGCVVKNVSCLKLDFFEVVSVKNLVSMEGIMSLYDLGGTYDRVISLLSMYDDRYEVFRYFLDCEMKFLFCLLFSRIFGMFCSNSYVWDSEKKVFLSGNLSSLFQVSNNIDRPDRYKEEFDGYLLLVLLGMEGVTWYFEFGEFIDFSYFFFESVLDFVDSFKIKVKSNISLIVRDGLAFCNWRDFLLELWFKGIFLCSYSLGKNFKLFFSILNDYNRKYMMSWFECFKYNFRQSFGLMFSSMLGDICVEFKKRSSVKLGVYCLKRRV